MRWRPPAGRDPLVRLGVGWNLSTAKGMPDKPAARQTAAFAVEPDSGDRPDANEGPSFGRVETRSGTLLALRPFRRRAPRSISSHRSAWVGRAGWSVEVAALLLRCRRSSFDEAHIGIAFRTLPVPVHSSMFRVLIRPKRGPAPGSSSLSNGDLPPRLFFRGMRALMTHPGPSRAERRWTPADAGRDRSALDGAPRRTILVVEDVHWTLQSDDVLTQLTVNSIRTRAVLIATYRPDSRGRCRPIGRCITLDPLSATRRELAQHILGPPSPMNWSIRIAQVALATLLAGGEIIRSRQPGKSSRAAGATTALSVSPVLEVLPPSTQSPQPVHRPSPPARFHAQCRCRHRPSLHMDNSARRTTAGRGHMKIAPGRAAELIDQTEFFFRNSAIAFTTSGPELPPTSHS